MKTYYLIGIFLLTSAVRGPQDAVAQGPSSDLEMFGYFQTQFEYFPDFGHRVAETSFLLQQLNLFLQKDVASNWRTFVNFEAINSFSTGRKTGSFSVEEAWARYRQSEKFNLKLGLSIPIFNHSGI